VLADLESSWKLREVGCTALFDRGSGYTIIRRTFFEKSFGPSWEKSSKPVKLHLVNGKFVEFGQVRASDPHS
jgi:hypothetical protein